MGNKKILLRKIILRLIIVMFIIIAFIVIVIAVINIYMKSVTSSKILSVDECKDMDADCILVLGAGVAPSGKPTWMLEDRILTSEELYNVNASPKIIMSGDHGRVSYDEVNTMKNYAINDGIPSEDIFMDHAGFETYDSMYRAKKIFGAKKVVISAPAGLWGWYLLFWQVFCWGCSMGCLWSSLRVTNSSLVWR